MANIKYGKVWGSTEPIVTNSFVEFARIETKAGGDCSIHKHEFKVNGFYVESGKLLIKVWQKSYDLVDETVLGPGDYMEVGAGLTHQFVCIEDAVAFEIYYPVMDHNDIKRDSVGSADGGKQVLTETKKGKKVLI